MGNIIAMGGGFGGEKQWDLAEYVISLTGKAKPNYLLIPTTAYDFADRGDIAVYAKMGCGTDILPLTQSWVTLAEIEKKIYRADLIQVPGGDLRFVSETWRRTGADALLRKGFMEGKTLFGSSSGSMCWFAEGYDDCGPRNSFMFVPALGLLPYCNVPHYENEGWQSFNDRAPEAGMSSICCENETAICYIGGKWSVMLSGERPDARVWFYDAEDGYSRHDLVAEPEILERL